MKTLSASTSRWLGGFGVALVGIAGGFLLGRWDRSQPEVVAMADPDSKPRADDIVRDSEAEPVTGPRALLIGVTDYRNLPGKNLTGPANDVELMSQLLRERFQFPSENIVRLTESAGRPEMRPTRANIERAFRQLAANVREGEQVVILLAGHGSRQPEPPDRKEEVDGFDEIFLPADVEPWKNEKERLPGAIVDNEIRDWLKAITEKKAYVWVIFDCCHSETMDRAWDAIERSRQIHPADLIPERNLVEATRRELQAGRDISAQTPFVRREADPYLVATYACRAMETTPEGPQPRYSPDGKVHGLFTYTLCQLLTQTVSPVTYRELVQRVQVQYARRLQGSPTPTAGGAGVDREVLGVRRWPGRSKILLRKTDYGYAVNAGQLHGLTRGTVLSVNGPTGTAADGNRLGHVSVTRLSRTTADVDPVEFDGQAAPAAVPDLAVCQVVFTDHGIDRARLAVDIPPGADRDAIVKAITPLADPKAGVVELVDRLSEAQWVIRFSEEGQPLLTEGPVRKRDEQTGRAPFKLPPVKDKSFTVELGDSVERMFRARALLSCSAAEDVARETAQLQIEIFRHTDEKSMDAERLRPTDGLLRLREGDWISYKVKNLSPFGVDFTLLVVGTDYSISAFYPQPGEKSTLDSQAEITTPRGRVQAPFGQEQLVAIAVPSQNPPIDFGVLAQPGMQTRRGRDTSRALETPIGQFLESSIYRVGNTRGLKRVGAEKEMGIRVMTWQSEPARNR